MKISRAIVSRAFPFILFIVLLMGTHGIEWLQENGQLSATWDLRWLYGLRVILPAIALRFYWRAYQEIRTPINGRFLFISVGVGLMVFVLWIHLTANWMVIGEMDNANGFSGFTNGQLDWPLILLRLTGAVLVVPIIEELFWRSFVMRIIDRGDFLSVNPKTISWMALFISSAVFAVEHPQWLAGLIAGLAYGGLYRWSGQLKTAIIAHAVTNLALGIWVVHTHEWYFW